MWTAFEGYQIRIAEEVGISLAGEADLGHVRSPGEDGQSAEGVRCLDVGAIDAVTAH